MIYSEQYVMDSVAVSCKIETEHFHEKSLVREDGWRSNWAYSEQKCRLACQCAERPYIYDPTSVVGPSQYSIFKNYITNCIDPLKPSGHYMYRQFNIHKFNVLPTQLYLSVLCGSQNKQPLFPYTTLTD